MEPDFEVGHHPALVGRDMTLNWRRRFSWFWLSWRRIRRSSLCGRSRLDYDTLKSGRGAGRFRVHYCSCSAGTWTRLRRTLFIIVW